MRGGLDVEAHDVGAGLRVLDGHLVGVGDHEVDVGRNGRVGLDGLHDVHAEREVGHEVAVHDVDVHVVCRGDGIEVGGEVGDVRREDGRGDHDVFEHGVPFCLAFAD